MFIHYWRRETASICEYRRRATALRINDDEKKREKESTEFERIQWEVGPRGKEIRTPLYVRKGLARDGPEQFRSPDAYEPDTPMRFSTWRASNWAQHMALRWSGGPGPRAPIRLISSRKRAVVEIAPRFSSSTNTLDKSACCSPSAPSFPLPFPLLRFWTRITRATAFRTDDPGNLLGIHIALRVFWIIKSFKYRLRSARRLSIYMYI